MARTAEKVRELREEDAGMRDALETVLERADGSVVQWGDVNDDLTSGQWGRLIEKGVLVDADGEGFRLADPGAVREELYGTAATGDGASADSEAVDAEEPEDTGWSKWDKIAGLLALSLFPGYYITEVRSTVGGLLNVLFGPVDQLLPFYTVILLLAVLTGLYSTLLQANLMDMEKMSYYQQQMKEIQERQKAAKERGDDEELERIREEQMEAMGDNLGMFKEQFRPMVWIMLLTIPVFLWMYWKLLGGHVQEAEMQVVMPFAGEVHLLHGSVGPMPAWIVWYFLCSMSLSQIIRKSLNIQTTPT